MLRLLGVFILSLSLFISCDKSEMTAEKKASPAIPAQEAGTYRPGIVQPNGTLLSGGVTLTAPTTVNVNENFNILAEVSCGRIAIDRGYILDANNVKIYKNLACNTPGLLYEELVAFQCYTNDASWMGSLPEVGTYVYRTRHNANDGNCDGLGGSNQTGNCTDFNGNEFYCFSIEVIGCSTEFTGEALTCGTQRQAVYRFTCADAQSYIKIQGGLTNFTGADAVITVSGGNLTSSQSIPGGSSNRVIRVEGSVGACEEIEITISWNSTNSGGVITGDWSVKDGNGVELAPSIPGLTCN